jgi:hypothetical protein
MLPNQPFDGIINAYGIRLTWRKSHQCPCMYARQMAGSPDPLCKTCFGLGWYWDPAGEPWMGLITFIHTSPTPDEPGTSMNTNVGMINRSEPAISIPSTAPNAYALASLNDIFIEIDSIDRFQTTLKVGGNQNIPYQNQLSVEPIGAVTVYDNVNHNAVFVDGYSVSGTQVTLPPEYPEGTDYVVEFMAAKAYVAWRSAGSIAHDRPFGGLNEPKRFRCRTLDLWLRDKGN